MKYQLTLAQFDEFGVDTYTCLECGWTCDKDIEGTPICKYCNSKDVGVSIWDILVDINPLVSLNTIIEVVQYLEAHNLKWEDHIIVDLIVVCNYSAQEAIQHINENHI